MKKSTRKVVRRSPSHTVRLLHLPHLQKEPVEADSALERDFVHIAALFSSTVSITHQPFKLVWEDASYTPDFLVCFKDGSQLVVEVKPVPHVEKYRPLFDRAAAKLNGRQTPFLVVTDQHLRTESRTANALLIRRYAKTSFPADDCERALQRVNESTAGISVAELCSIAGVCRELILHLVAWHRLALSADLSFGPEARVFKVQNSKETSNALLFTSWIDAQVWG
jgi:hypothetical protein